jgi:hypothetical protein
MAGLNMFEPNPPKTILPIAMAKTLPITATHHGTAGGSDSARIMPVTTALRSSSEFDFLQITLQSHSVTMHEIMQTEITSMAWSLKNSAAAAIAGTRAMTTSNMMLRVE